MKVLLAKRLKKTEPSNPQNCLKSQFIPKFRCYKYKNFTCWHVIISKSGKTQRIQSKWLDSILSDVILSQDVEVHSDIVMYLLQSCSLKEERHEESTILSEDWVNFSKIALLVLIVEESFNIDGIVNTESWDIGWEVFWITNNKLSMNVTTLWPVSSAILNVGSG